MTDGNFNALDNERLSMLWRFTHDMQREFCILCLPGCPMTTHNLFDDLRTALEAKDGPRVAQIISIEVVQMERDAKGMVQIAHALRHVFGIMGDALEEGE